MGTVPLPREFVTDDVDLSQDLPGDFDSFRKIVGGEMAPPPDFAVPEFIEQDPGLVKGAAGERRDESVISTSQLKNPGL